MLNTLTFRQSLSHSAYLNLLSEMYYTVLNFPLIHRMDSYRGKRLLPVNWLG